MMPDHMQLAFDKGTEKYNKSPVAFSVGTCGKQVCDSLSNIGIKAVDSLESVYNAAAVMP